MTRRLIAMGALIGSLSWADDAAADTPLQRFAELSARILDAKRSEIANRGRAEETRPYRRLADAPDNTAVITRALDPDVAGSASGRMSAAIKTDIDGAEAGVSINPGILLSASNPVARGFTLTVASLERSRARFGLAWSHEIGPVLLTPGDVGLAACSVDIEDFERTLNKLAPTFAKVCEQVVRAVPRPAEPADQRVWQAAQIACGYVAREPTNNPGLSEAIVDIRTIVQKSQDVDTRQAMLAIEPLYEELMRFKALDPMSCYEQAPMRRGHVQAAWASTRQRIGVSGNVELFPRVFGFNPDPEMDLPNGDVESWKARVEYGRSADGRQIAVSAGYGQSRLVATDDLEGVISASASLIGFTHGLTARPFRTDGKVNPENGELPAYFSLGLDVRADFATSPPDSLDTRLNVTALEASVFADFHLTGDLSFRIGVPVKGEIATRPSDPMAMPPVEEKRALQWTLQPFVATVLKI